MSRFSVNLPDKLDSWLQQQAAESNRTKNGQLVHLIEQAQQRQPRRVEFLCGCALSCGDDRHRWRVDVPMEGDGCNCGKVRW